MKSLIGERFLLLLPIKVVRKIKLYPQPKTKKSSLKKDRYANMPCTFKGDVALSGVIWKISKLLTV